MSVCAWTDLIISKEIYDIKLDKNQAFFFYSACKIKIRLLEFYFFNNYT